MAEQQTETRAARLAPGDQVGRSRIVRHLGGDAYEAAQVGPDRAVVVRLLDAATSAGAVARFGEEAELLQRLPHGGIAAVHEIGTVADRRFVAAEYVPGSVTILDHLASASRREKLNFLAFVCDAVQHGHNLGIRHGNLKPSTVLVRDGRPRVVDFGVPRAPVARPEAHHALDDEPDVRTDVYALGALAYRVLTGRPPLDLDGLGPDEARTAIAETPPAPARLPVDLEAVLFKALSKDPELRYSSALELAEDLRRFLRRQPVLACPASPLHRAWLAGLRRPVVAFVVPALVAGLGVALAMQVAETGRIARARATAEEHAYLATVAAADAALRLDDAAAATRQLERAPAALRGWEWRHLRGRVDGRAPARLDAGDVRRFAWAPDGALMTLGPGGTVRWWDAATGAAAGRIEAGGDPVGAAHASDGATLFLFDRDGRARVFARGDGEMRRVVHIAPPARIAFDARGERLFAVSSEDGALRVHGLVTGTPASRPVYAGEAPLTALAFHRAAAVLATGARDGSVRLWQDRSFRPVADVAGTAAVTALAFDPRARLLAAAGADGVTVVRDARTLAERFRVAGTAPCFSPDGARLATVATDATVRLWDTRAGEPVLVLRGLASAPRQLAFAPDGTLAAACADGVCLWYR